MTNIITITNLVFVVSTNAVPVTLSGFDYTTVLTLYLDGFANGAPCAVALAACALIYKSLSKPNFPSSD